MTVRRDRFVLAMSLITLSLIAAAFGDEEWILLTPIVALGLVGEVS